MWFDSFFKKKTKSVVRFQQVQVRMVFVGFLTADLFSSLLFFFLDGDGQAIVRDANTVILKMYREPAERGAPASSDEGTC